MKIEKSELADCSAGELVTNLVRNVKMYQMQLLRRRSILLR